MQARVDRQGLAVAAELAAFVEAEALPGTGVEPDAFWAGYAAILRDLAPRNAALLARREELQSRIDDWHIARRGQPHDAAAYEAFLREIGYILPEGPDFTIETTGVDPEIALIPGPQLVVPVSNARFALNAANARWGSLHDALYGTDALGDLPAGGAHDPARGARVVAWARAHLDAVVPLAGARWADVTALDVADGVLRVTAAGRATGLADPGQFAGYLRDDLCELRVLLRVNGLLIEVLVDRSSVVGAADPAGISDIQVEAAVSSIMDLEDSVAAVDAADKVQCYRTWLGLMTGALREKVAKAGRVLTRSLNPDASYLLPDGGALPVRRRALMLVRNVGHLMTTPAVLDAQGGETPEGIMDAWLSVLCAMHDLRKADGPRNSTTGAVYVVKPKMHGPDEVSFACEILDRVEDVLGLPRHRVKIGIMDEERRTSVNLRECIRAARHRLAFINTGFLDRTGDEIHTSMEAGPMLPKGAMKGTPWIAAYEDRNVAIALACGFSGRAQIGKGMWAQPDEMAAMLATKSAHPKSGATTAWVPSPTAATLHALHYHATDVFAGHAARAGAAMPSLAALLTIPLAPAADWSAAEIADELDTNVQSMLGYVVRWIDQGVGCSKVPDLADIGLMEDRATLRISSQHIANWLLHGVVSSDDVEAALTRMARRVDAQNAGAPGYRSLLAAPGIALRTCRDLVYHGLDSPNGYTEPLLHAGRAEAKRLG